MCTILLEPETLPAKKRSIKDSQKAVDDLMELEHRLTAPFDHEELTELLKKKPIRKREYPLLLTDTVEQCEAAERSSDAAIQHADKLINCQFRKDDDPLTPAELWMLFNPRDGQGSIRDWSDYRLLSEDEQEIVDALGITPKEKKLSPLTDDDRERRLFLLRRSCIIQMTIPEVLRYDCRHGQFAGRSFYYIVTDDCLSSRTDVDEFAALKKELGSPSDNVTAQWLSVLKSRHIVLEKGKLRPYQIAYLEVRCRKAEKSLCSAMKRLDIEDEELEQAQRLWDRWQLLTEEEKQLAEKFGLTPVQPKTSKRRNNIWDTVAKIGPDSKPESVEERRLELKTGLFHIPRNIFVWLDNMNYCSEEKGFYYVRYQNSMLWNGTTAYAHPVLVVQKSKLRPDQVEYMEHKCRETIDDAKKKMKDESAAEPEIWR